MSVKFPVGDTSQFYSPSSQYLTRLVNERPALNKGAVLQFPREVFTEHQPTSTQALVERLPHTAPKDSPSLANKAVAKLMHWGIVREMPPQELRAHYDRYPEHKLSDHDRAVIRNGIQLTTEATVTIGSLLIGGGAFGAYKLSKYLPLKALRKELGFSRASLSGKAFEQAPTQKAILAGVNGARGKLQAAQTRLSAINAELETIRLEMFNYRRGPARADLERRQTALQQELEWIEKDVARMTENTIRAANKQLEAIGSHQRIDKNFYPISLPSQAIKAQTDELIMATHPQLWAAAHSGDQKAIEALRVLKYTVGANPTNVAKKNSSCGGCTHWCKSDLPSRSARDNSNRNCAFPIASTTKKCRQGDRDRNSAHDFLTLRPHVMGGRVKAAVSVQLEAGAGRRPFGLIP